jgi:hypothetical protein
MQNETNIKYKVYVDKDSKGLKIIPKYHKSPILDFMIRVIKSQEFYISLIFPLICVFFLTLVNEKPFVVIVAFALGLSMFPIIKTFGEILKNNKWH